MDKYSNGENSSRLQIPVADKTIVSELSGDFILPDYQPEIKRLLRVGAVVLPPSKYISDRDVELAGNVDYYVFYTGSDNAPYCAPLTAEYKINLPIDCDAEADGFFNPTGCGAVILPDMISGRVTAPRKINIKCRLKSRVQVAAEMPIEDGYSHGEDGLQVLRGEVLASEYLRGSGDIWRVSDEMICDSREGDVRVVSAEGRTLISEVTVGENTVSCRGDLYLKLLLCKEDDGVPYVTVRKMPISGSVSVDGANRGDSATAKASVCELNVTVEEGRIGIEAGVLTEVQVAHEQSVGYVKDVYSVAHKSENEYKTVGVPVDAICFGGNFTLSDSLPLGETGIAPGARIIDTAGVASVEEYSFEGGKCTLGGKAKFSMLTEKDGEFGVSEIELPFSYKTPVGSDVSKAVCECEVISARAREDGERVGVDAEIGLSGSAYAVKNEKMLANAVFGDEIDSRRGEMVVCYPAGDDTLWSVAKRYGAELSGLRASNKLPSDISPDAAESLKKVNFLVI